MLTSLLQLCVGITDFSCYGINKTVLYSLIPKFMSYSYPSTILSNTRMTYSYFKFLLTNTQPLTFIFRNNQLLQTLATKILLNEDRIKTGITYSYNTVSSTRSVESILKLNEEEMVVGILLQTTALKEELVMACDKVRYLCVSISFVTCIQAFGSFCLFICMRYVITVTIFITTNIVVNYD